MAIATLRIQFFRPGTDDRGEMTFEGESDFISNCASPVSYVVSWLNATYGADRDNWMNAGNELMAAWEAAKEGKDFNGEIVRVTFKE